MDYSFVHCLNDALVVLDHPKYGQLLWAKFDKLRKDTVCQVTELPIAKGSPAWRPTTNGNNRMHRISDAGIEILMIEKKHQLTF